MNYSGPVFSRFRCFRALNAVLAILFFCLPALTTAQMVSEQDFNKLVIMDYMETFSTEQRDIVAAKVLAPDHELVRSEFHNMRHHALGSELMDNAEDVQVAIHDRRDVVDVVMADGDAVAVRYRIHGVHGGNLYGIPATGETIDIQSAAIFWLEDGQITKSWFMADEIGLLTQIDQPMPDRKDGRWEAGPINLPAKIGDEHLAELLENPIDSQEYRNKVIMAAYKAVDPPEAYFPPPGGNGTPLRRGFAHLIDYATPENAEKYPFINAFPDRVNMIPLVMSDGKWTMLLFQLTAVNTVSLFGIPAQDRKVSAYEIGFMPFDGETWDFRWFYGDDLGMLMQLGGTMDYFFPED